MFILNTKESRLMMDSVLKALKSGEKVKITGLGMFTVRLTKARGERMGRNLKTGEPIKIPASLAKKKVSFRATKELKEAIN